MFLYREELMAARETLRNERNLRIVGSHQSGRSTLIRQIAVDAEASGFEVILTQGDSLAQLQPGRVLEELRAAIGLGRKHRGLGDSIDEICERISSASFLLIDDVHLADSVSLRALHEIRNRLSLRVVVSVLQGCGREEDFPAVWPERVLRLPPLDLTATGMVMRELLGGPIAPGAVVRVYAKSGGVVGVAPAIIEGARDRGLLHQVEGIWRLAGQSLWSDDLIPFVDSLLGYDDAALRSLMRALSWSGPRSLESLVSAHSLELIERGLSQGYLALAEGVNETRLQVWPPIFADRFRGAPERILYTEDSSSQDSHSASPFHPHSSDHALLARSFSDHADQVLKPLYAAWNASRTAADASQYLREALGLSSEASRIERVVTETRATLRDPNSDEFEFYVQLVAWTLVVEEDSVGARKHLDTLALFSPHLSGTAESIWELMGALNGAGAPPSDFEVANDPYGFSVAVRASGAVMRGLVTEADEAIHELHRNGQLRYLYAYLFGMQELLKGNPDSALEFVHTERDVARATFDRPMFATLSYISAVIHFYLGDTDAANDAIEEGLVIGRPRLTMTPIYAAMLNLQAMSAHFRGQAALRDDLVRTAAQLSSAPGPFLGIGLDIIEIMMSAEPGMQKITPERDIAVAAAIKIRTDRGYNVGAIQMSFAVLSFEFSAPVVAALTEAEAFADETVYRRPIKLANALVANDLELATAVLAEAPNHHDHALLSRLVASAARRAERENNNELSAALFSLVQEEVPQPEFVIEKQRALLSKRELEVARLASSMSNPEIAERLSLSRRTVENHISNALKKLGAKNRAELVHLIEQV